MTVILVVESSEPWVQFYKRSLGGLSVEILCARTLPDAYYLWRLHGFGIAAVIIDENMAGEGHGDPALFAQQIVAEWSARETEGSLVLVADSPPFRRDLELAGFTQELKRDAICAMLGNLPAG